MIEKICWKSKFKNFLSYMNYRSNYMKKLILTLFLLLLSNTYILAANSGIGIEVVKFVDSINIKSFNYQPLLIRDIEPGSPAERAHIKAPCYITSINGESVYNLSEQEIIQKINSKETVQLGITEGGNNPERIVNIQKEQGYDAVIKYLHKTKGIGLGIYKSQSDLKMPILITNVEKGSPSYTAGIRENSLILDVNGVSTIDLNVDECLKALNANKLLITVVDINSKNTQKYNLTKANYYANSNMEIKDKNRKIINQNANTIYAPYNEEEKVLSTAFAKLAPEYKRSKMTNQEIWNADISKMQKAHEQYKNDKNNMAFNKFYYDGLQTFIKQFSELRKWQIDNIKSALIIYGKLPNNATEQQVIMYIKNSNISNKDYYINYIDYLNKYINIYSDRAKEVYNYSSTYEKNKKAQLTKFPAKYVLDGDLTGFMAGFKTPKQNGAYKLNEKGIGFVQVKQSIPNGIIVGAYSSHYTDRPLCIITNKSFADDEIIKEQMYFLYDGYYSYTTVLGAPKKIWKFKEISKATYDNIADKQSGKYYFIK